MRPQDEQNPVEGDKVPEERQETAPKPGPSVEGAPEPITDLLMENANNNTVKKILNEILDCTLIPTTSNPRALTGGSEIAMKDILGEILDCTIRKKPETEQEGGADVREAQPGPSRACRSEPCMLPAIYTVLNAPESLDAIRQHHLDSSTFLRSLNKLLPSYSTVMKSTPAERMETVITSDSFVPPVPPPRYAETDEMWGAEPSMVSIDRDSLIFGPDPMYMICPRCRIVVVTDTEMEHSFLTHLLALGMCVFLCWPCCLLPYCLKTFNNIYHTCPYCNYYFGAFTPV